MEKVKAILSKVILYLGTTVSFMAFYFLTNFFFLKVFNVELSDYKGINKMGRSPLGEYLNRSLDAYKEFFYPDKHANYYMYFGNIKTLYYVILFLIITLNVIVILKLKKTNYVIFGIYIFMLLLFPMCINFIFVMTGKGEVHSLMVYSQVFTYIFGIWLIEKVEINNSFISELALICILVICIMYCRFDNRCYFKANYTQQEAISYYTTLVTQIKCTKGYSDDLPITFVNEENFSDCSLKPIEELRDIKMVPYWDTDLYIKDNIKDKYMSMWCGYSPVIVEQDRFVGMDEVKKMPSYPNEGAIRIIDNTIVIKF